MTNNEKLKMLIKKYGLSHNQLSELVLHPINSTRAWTCRPETKRYASVHASIIKLLELQIKEKNIKPV